MKPIWRGGIIVALLAWAVGCSRGDAAENAGQGTSLDLVVSAAALRQAQINRALRDFDLVRARIDALLALADCHW